MTFSQLIEYNMKIFFLKNQAQNVMEKLVPDPFLKNQDWAYLWIKVWNFIQSDFILMFKSKIT